MSQTYIERLQDVNRRLNTMAIRGKEYAEVNQRVLGFWELFPDGRIVTRWPTINETEAVARAFVFKDRAALLEVIKSWCWGQTTDDGGAAIDVVLEIAADATGTAREVRTGGGVNSTSHVENAETSAIGRALGFLGIGATNAIASAEEVQNAIEAQEQAKRRSSRSKADSRPVTANPDKVPGGAAKTSQKAPQAATAAKDDATEAARRRLIDACNLLAVATGRDPKEIMQHVAKQHGFEKTADGYDAAAAWVMDAAKAQGVKEV